jgi:hypothetical protein
MSERSLQSRQSLNATLPNVPVVEFDYHRRPRTEFSALRESFQETDRQAFLTHLLQNRSDDLRARGFTERNLESLRRGKVPHGYNVHHIRPLDDGGDNRFDNLVLLRAHPEHESIHRHLDPQLRGLAVGQSRRVNLAMPEAGAYRSPQQDKQIDRGDKSAAKMPDALLRRQYSGVER